MDKATPGGENGENGEASPPSISKVINKLSGAYNKLNGQITKATAAVQIKNEVCDEVQEAINLLRQLRKTLCGETIATLATMRDEMKELKTTMT
jgi:protein-arginine kinase activator protein McsA